MTSKGTRWVFFANSFLFCCLSTLFFSNNDVYASIFTFTSSFSSRTIACVAYSTLYRLCDSFLPVFPFKFLILAMTLLPTRSLQPLYTIILPTFFDILTMSTMMWKKYAYNTCYALAISLLLLMALIRLSFMLRWICKVNFLNVKYSIDFCERDREGTGPLKGHRRA